jgi:predicted Zn-dependent protease
MSRRDKLEQMLKREPDDPFLHYGLAMELIKEGQVEAALERFDRTLSIDAGYVAAYFHKGNTLVAQGRIEDARETLRAGIQSAVRKQDTHAQGEMQGLLDSLE